MAVFNGENEPPSATLDSALDDTDNAVAGLIEDDTAPSEATVSELDHEVLRVARLRYAVKRCTRLSCRVNRSR